MWTHENDSELCHLLGWQSMYYRNAWRITGMEVLLSSDHKWYNILKFLKKQKTCWNLSRDLRFLLGTLEEFIDFQIFLIGACYITAFLEIRNANISLWMELFRNFLPFVFIFCILYQMFPDILHTIQHKQNQRKPTFISGTDSPLECTLCITRQTGTFCSIYCITGPILIIFFYWCKYLSSIIKALCFPNWVSNVYISHVRPYFWVSPKTVLLPVYLYLPPLLLFPNISGTEEKI